MFLPAIHRHMRDRQGEDEEEERLLTPAFLVPQLMSITLCSRMYHRQERGMGVIKCDVFPLLLDTPVD